MSKYFKGIAAMLIAAVLIISGCSDDSGGTYSYKGTQSPGDVWLWTLTPTTFEGKNETTGYTYSGTKAVLSNKFLKLTVDTTDDPGLTPPAVAYALENPGTALIVKPAGTDSKVIVSVAKGACPTTGNDFNWVVIPHMGWDTLADEAYGAATSTVSGATVNFAITKNLLAGGSLGSGAGSFTCTDGVMTDSSSTIFAIASTGTMIGDNGPGLGGIVGVIAPDSAIVDSDFTLTGKEFRGVLFKNEDAAAEDTQPVWVRGLGGTLKGGGYTDFELGTEETVDTVVISLNTQSAPGIYNATLTPSGGTCPADCSDFVLMVNKIGSKYVAYGIAESDSAAGKAYNIMMMEQ